MTWTQKEASLLEDLKAQEHLCVEKYGKYAAQAIDPQLKQLFTQLQSREQQHEQTVTQMLNGQLPQQNMQQNQQQTGSQQSNQQQGMQNQPNKLQGAQLAQAKQADAYLCQDALSTEKHVSAVYDTSIFEFISPQARQALNQLQADEQQHGEMIYAYMAQNGMSA